jgi:hypothetical protein
MPESDRLHPFARLAVPTMTSGEHVAEGLFGNASSGKHVGSGVVL